MYIHTYTQLQETEDFLGLFHQFIEEGLFDIELGLTEIIIESPEESLKNIRSRDINIIMGFFGPKNARDVLCLVSITVQLYKRVAVDLYKKNLSAKFITRFPMHFSKSI